MKKKRTFLVEVEYDDETQYNRPYFRHHGDPDKRKGSVDELVSADDIYFFLTDCPYGWDWFAEVKVTEQ